jgi:hypothetical protein
MKNLKSYNQFIFEAMKTVKDLNPNIGLFIHEDSLTLYDPETDRSYGYIGLSNKGDYYTFPAVAAEKGFGPLVYELALMYVKSKNSSLMVSRDGDIRGEAFEVWKKFYYRDDVDKKTLPFESDDFNFALITGDETFDSDVQKQVEYEFHVNDGYEEDIKIYNTKMSMEPSEDFFMLQKKHDNINLENASRRGHDFFSYRYSE